MELHFKQHDIEKAIKDKLTAEGFPMRSKTLTIDFSMGRGTNGLSAVLNIDDIEIPGDPTIGSAVLPTTLAVQGAIAPAPAAKPVAAPVEQPSPVVAVVDDQVEEATTAPATVAEIQEAAVATITGTDLAAELTQPAATPAVAEANEAAAPVAEVAATPTLFSGATAAVATPETEAAAAEPVVEAKTAEAPAVTSTKSLFGTVG